MKYRRRLPTHGQSLVEFALVAPLLFAFMFILVELGIIFSVYIGLTNSAREVARVGSAYQYPTPDTLVATNACAVYNNRDTVDIKRKEVMDSALMSTLNPIIRVSSADDLDPLPNPPVSERYSFEPAFTTPSPCDSSTPYPSLDFNVYRYTDKLIVKLSYQHDLFFSLLGPHTVTITAHSQMQIEPGGVPMPTPTPTP